MCSFVIITCHSRDVYRTHRWLIKILGKHFCVADRDPAKLLPEDEDTLGSASILRDHADKVDVVYNREVTAKGFGINKKQLGMEPILWYKAVRIAKDCPSPGRRRRRGKKKSPKKSRNDDPQIRVDVDRTVLPDGVVDTNAAGTKVRISMNWRSMLSDEIRQDSKTVFTNTRKLITYLRENHGLLLRGSDSVLYIRSDGCAAQYRSANCCYMNQKLAKEVVIQIDWMIMASHHGKSLCGCLGGCDKCELKN